MSHIDGCPTPGDSDGDGVLDEEDACPEERGLPDDAGCPDRDGDSVPDHLDADPDDPGSPETDGAPDGDGDTVPDDHDLAPEDPGDPGGGGAPESDAPDSDGDGAADDVDPCPHEYGEPEDGYCPPPEDDPAPEDDGPVFDGPGDFFEDVEIPVNIEIEAYEFGVSREFDHVWCYVQLADADMQRYEFEPEGEQQWNIRDVLGGENSVHLVALWGEPLSVYIDCGADNIYPYEDDGDGVIGDGGAWGTVYDLGTHTADHGSLEWDGRELIASGIGPDGESFLARYRICSPTCDETALQAPILDPITLGPRGEGPYNIRWRWDGNEDWIDGFAMVVNGTISDATGLIEPNIRSLDIGDFRPECGEVFEFRILAYGVDPVDGTFRRSPYSNTRVWDGETCPRTVMVTFLSFDTSGLGGRQGPISGTFFANDQTLIADYRDGPPSFDATDDPERYLSPGRTYNIAELFEDIERDAASCLNCTWNYAPSVNHIEVELGPREALTFGANIWKEGGGRAFEGWAYVPVDMLVPGEYVVYDNGINMTVLVDVLVGPEAGGIDHLPDLTITDITAEETSGQLLIHIFNNASDLFNENISVNLVRMSTNEQIEVHTWENITLPSGRSMILQSGSLIHEPYDLRAIIDPDNAIDEINERNNIYETPVLMRIEFLRAFAPYCNEISCNIFDCDSEHVFHVWAGHGPEDGGATWVGYNVRFPTEGEIRVCGREPCTSDEDWSMAGNDRYTFEFEMPASDVVHIMVTGYENDPGLAADDSLGRVSFTYNSYLNYGARAESYQENYGHETSYGEGSGNECPVGLWATWRITRIH